MAAPATNGEPKPEEPTTTITGEIPDLLIEMGRRPTADVRREYIAGGSSSFPLVSQQVLSQAVDDLAQDLGSRVYEVMLNDPTVSGAVHILITGILSGQFQIIPSIRPEDGEEVEPDSAREAEIETAQYWADFCKRSIDGLDVPIKSICYDLLLGSFAYGCKLAEKVFKEGEGQDEGRITLDKIRVKRSQSWNFVVDPPGNVVAIRAMCFDVGIHDLPPDKFMICTWMPRDADPRGRSLLRGAYNGWNLKLNAWPKYFKYLELFGQPFIVGIASPDGDSEDQLDDKGNPTGRQLTPTEALAEQLARLGSGSFIVARSGTTITLGQATGNGEAFEKFFNLTKNEILEGILHSARAMLESKRNSQADADQSQDVVGNIMIFGREWMEMIFGGRRKSLFHQLVEINAGSAVADKYAPGCSLGQVEHQDIAKTAMAYAALGYQIEPFQSRAIDGKLSLPVRDKVTTNTEPPAGQANGKPTTTNGKPAVGDTNGKPVTMGEGEDGADPFVILRNSFKRPLKRRARPKATWRAASATAAAAKLWGH